MLIISFSFFLLSLLYPIYPQWTQQNSGTQKLLLNLYFFNEELGWVCGYDGTILKTTNGGAEWISKNIGTLDDIHDIFFIDSLKGWAVLYEFSPFRHGSIIHSTDGGNSWNVQLSVLDYTFHSIHFSDNNNGWVAGSNGIVYHTTNGGTTWFQQYPPTAGGWLWPIFFIDNNVGWTAGDPLFGLFKSTNGGLTWSTYYVPVVERIHSIIFLDNQTGWLCGTQGQVAKSINGGITWQNLQSGTSAYLRDIFFLDFNTGWSVGYNGTIIHSIDGGNIWTPQQSNTSNNLYAVQFINPEIGWTVGGNGTILKTINGGIPVELINFSVKVNETEVILDWITATEINNSGFEIERRNVGQEWLSVGFVAGHGTISEKQIYQFKDRPEEEGCYDYRLKQIDFDGTFEYSNEVSVEYTPEFSFALEQNYPNPFNPNTKIKYSIPQNDFVTLSVFNSLGERVALLEEGMKEAGNYEIEFNGNNLPSGIYFYTLNSGEFKQTKKLIILK